MINPYGALAAFVLVSGLGRWWIAWRQNQWVRRTARTILDGRRALYTEIPVQRRLTELELRHGARGARPDVERVSGFRATGGLRQRVCAGSRFEKLTAPQRVLVDAERTTAALVFRPPSSDVVRIHLATELGDGRWSLTENNKGELAGGFYARRTSRSFT